MAKSMTKTKGKKKGADAEKGVSRGRIERNLKPRTADTYDEDNQLEGRGAGGGLPPDDYTVKEDLCNVEVIRPRYKEGPLYFGVFPQLDPKDPENRLRPGRVKAAALAQTKWIHKEYCAPYIGKDEKVTYIMPHRTRQKKEFFKDPYWVFYKACKDAEEAGKFGKGMAWSGTWNQLMKGSKTKGGAAIVHPKPKFYMQGYVFQNGDRNYMDDEDRELPYGLQADDPLVVIEINENAGLQLMKLLDTPNKGFDGEVDESDPDSLWEAFAYHAIGRIDYEEKTISGGKILLVFNPGVTKISEKTSWDGQKPKNKAPWNYEAAVRNVFKVDDHKYTATLKGDQFDEVFNKVQFWRDATAEDGTVQPGLLRYLSTEEKCLLIAKAFASVPKLVKFAWADHDEFLTDDVKGVLNSRASAVNPGTAGEDEDEDDDDQDDDDQDDDEEATPKKKAKKDVVIADKKKPKKADDDEDEDTDDDDDDDDADDDDDDAGDEEEEEEEEEDDAAGDDDEDADDADDDSDDDAGDDDDDDDDAGDDDEDDTSSDDDEEGEDDDSDADGDDDDDDADEDEEESKPKPKDKKKPSAKQQEDDDYFGDATKPPEKPAGSKGGKDKGKDKGGKKKSEATYEEDDAAKSKEKAMAKSQKAAKDAADRAKNRKNEAKEPPAAQGGSAGRKKTSANGDGKGKEKSGGSKTGSKKK